jgi:hypothetical protein
MSCAINGFAGLASVAEVILCDVGEAALLSHICRFDQKP